MYNISHSSPSLGFTARQQPSPDYQSAAYARQRSLKTDEKLDTALTIQTRDGDLVTLNSSHHSSMDAQLYDSAGMIRTENGAFLATEKSREITLSSGESFSFTVNGDLSEEELADIDALLQGLDKVVTEMKGGNMEGALGQAMQLEGYDTFASFAADISLERSVQMTSGFAAQSSRGIPESVGSTDKAEQPQSTQQSSTASPAVVNSENTGADFGQLFDRMFNLMEQRANQLFERSARPIEKLLSHHQKGLDEQTNDSASTLFSTLSDARDSIASRLRERFNTLLGEQLAAGQDNGMDEA